MRTISRFVNLCVILSFGLCQLSAQDSVCKNNQTSDRIGVLGMYDGNLDSQPWRGTFVHRGLYQVYGGVVPENSVAAIKNAFGKHFAGVEIDIRLSKDGVPIVIHDKIINRSVVNCNFVYLTIDAKAPDFGDCPSDATGVFVPLKVNRYNASQITDHGKTGGWLLNAYGQNAALTRTKSTLKTLESLLYDVGCDLSAHPQYSIILDLQDYATVSAAAKVVEKSRFKGQIFLKIFATAVSPSIVAENNVSTTSFETQLKAWGTNLNYILQFNSSQLNPTSGVASVNAFGKTFDPSNYVRLWQNASSATGHASFSYVGVSLPPPCPPSGCSWKVNSQNAAIDQLAHDFAGNMIGIYGNPDVGTTHGNGVCKWYRFNGTALPVSKFSWDTERTRQLFAKYLPFGIVDVVQDNSPSSTWSHTRYTDYFCNGAPYQNVQPSSYSSGSSFASPMTQDTSATAAPAATLEAGPPPTAILCAAEGGTCEMPASAILHFAANGSSASMPVTQSTSGPVSCSLSTVGGVDPAPGTPKQCFYEPVAENYEQSQPGFVRCALEGGTCNVPTGAAFYYGANDLYFRKDNVSGPVTCSTSMWGDDPLPGVAKSCFYLPGAQAVPAPTGWTLCAVGDVGQTCDGQGGPVLYGVSGRGFVTQQAAGVIDCSVATFGSDPAERKVKGCYVPQNGLSNGMYRFANASSNLVLEGLNGQATNGSGVSQDALDTPTTQLWTNVGTEGSNQLWQVKNQGGDLVQMVNVGSGLALDNACQTNAESSVYQWQVNGGACQPWLPQWDTNSNRVVFLSQYAMGNAAGLQLALQDPGSNPNPGVIDQAVNQNTMNQEWSVTPLLLDGVYSMLNSQSSLVLENPNSGIANGTVPWQTSQTGNASQQWIFTSVGDGYFTIQNVYNSLFLDDANSSSQNGTPIWQWQQTGGTNQEWMALPNADGSFRLMNKNSGKVLQINNSGANQGDQASQWDSANVPWQNWWLSQVSATN